MRAGAAGRGLTLVEIVLSLGLVGLGIVFLVSIIPTSVLTLKRAEDLQTATAYAVRLIQEAQHTPPSVAGRDREEKVELNGTIFEVSRESIRVDDSLMDVIVTVRWRDDTPPVRLATRVASSVPDE